MTEAVRRLCSADATFTHVGMKLVIAKNDQIVLGLTIQPHMTNGGGVTHGGWIFMLADTAFAYLATITNPEILTARANIEFHRPILVGEHITATATVSQQTALSLFIDVKICNASDVHVASFQGEGRPPRRKLTYGTAMNSNAESTQSE